MYKYLDALQQPPVIPPDIITPYQLVMLVGLSAVMCVFLVMMVIAVIRWEDDIPSPSKPRVHHRKRREYMIEPE